MKQHNIFGGIDHLSNELINNAQKRIEASVARYKKVYVKPSVPNKPNHFQFTIKNLIWRLRSIKEPGLLEAIRKGVEENEEFILNIVRQEQLYDSGVNGYNVSIDSYEPYKPFTQYAKIKKQQPIDRVTLCDTGAFYDSMQIKFTAKGFYIEAKTNYVPDLMEKYGEAVLRITNENFTYVVVPLLRIYAFDYVYKMLYSENPMLADIMADRMKSRLTKDYKNLRQYI